MKSIIEKIKDLEILAGKDKCDDKCDMTPPYESCPECKARKLLNEIGEMLK